MPCAPRGSWHIPVESDEFIVSPVHNPTMALPRYWDLIEYHAQAFPWTCYPGFDVITWKPLAGVSSAIDSNVLHFDNNEPQDMSKSASWSPRLKTCSLTWFWTIAAMCLSEPLSFFNDYNAIAIYVCVPVRFVSPPPKRRCKNNLQRQSTACAWAKIAFRISTSSGAPTRLMKNW